MKGMSINQKMRYIKDYYFIKIVISLFLILVAIFAGSAVYYNTFDKTELYVTFVNSTMRDATEEKNLLNQGFSDYLNNKIKPSQIIVNTGYTISREGVTGAYHLMLMSIVSSKTLDVYITDDALLDIYASDDHFKNLDEFLPSDMKEKLSDKFIYKEGSNNTKYPVAVDISDTTFFKEAGITKEPIYIAIVANAPHPETTISFIKYVYGL